jgi:hypothetical protein
MAGIAAAGLAAASHAQSFPSVNSVGFVPVTIPPAGGFVQVGCNLQSLGGAGAIGVVEFFASNQLVRANSPAGATTIHLWDFASQNYVTIYQRLDGRYRLTTGAYTNYPIRTGDAMWLQSPSTSTVAKTVYLVGEVLGTQSAQRTVPTGITMVANPFPYAWYLNGTNMTWVVDGAKRGAVGSADNIYIWNNAISNYEQYYLRTANSNWCSAANNAVMTTAVPAGGGFWYLARGTNFTSRMPRVTGL